MKLYKIILFTLLLVTSSVFSQRETLDKIIAIVGDEVILASELANQLQLYVFQINRQPSSQEELNRWQEQILNQMISDRLFLIAARKDTSIVIREEEIEETLNQQIDNISSRFNSYDEFQQELANEGITLRGLRKKLRVDIENQILKQRFIQKKMYSVSISNHEVGEFYGKFKDSIPPQPEGINLAHLLLTIQPSPKVEDSIRQYVNSLRQTILNGADFATISSQYSSPGAGVNGGDLGYVSKDDIFPEISRAAFNLSVGDISGVIRSPLGFHVIKCEGKKEDKLHLRHLLITVQPTKADTLRVMNVADSLLQECRNGANFEELVKIFSDDEETKTVGGEFGWLATAQLPPDFAKAVSGWKEPGDYRGPLLTQFGYHILKLIDYQPAKVLTLEDDFDQIKEMARQDKTGKIVDEWIDDMKKDIFVDIME